MAAETAHPNNPSMMHVLEPICEHLVETGHLGSADRYYLGSVSGMVEALRAPRGFFSLPRCSHVTYGTEIQRQFREGMEFTVYVLVKGRNKRMRGLSACWCAVSDVV